MVKSAGAFLSLLFLLRETFKERRCSRLVQSAIYNHQTVIIEHVSDSRIFHFLCPKRYNIWDGITTYISKKTIPFQFTHPPNRTTVFRPNCTMEKALLFVKATFYYISDAVNTMDVISFVYIMLSQLPISTKCLCSWSSSKQY